MGDVGFQGKFLEFRYHHVSNGVIHIHSPIFDSYLTYS
jgi:hypothetical protein